MGRSGKSAAKKKERKQRTKENKARERAKKVEIEKRLAQKAEEELKKQDEEKDDDFEIEYVAARPDVGNMNEFSEVFERFEARAGLADGKPAAADEDAEQAVKKEEAVDSDDEDMGDADGAAAGKKKRSAADDDEEAVSNRERKRRLRQHVGALKQLTDRPDLVEVWDATAVDPEFLVFLKSYRNSVPVPLHWQQKRRYLHGKRSVDKKPFELPDFIAATGIQRLREAYVERENAKRMRAQGREKLQPKMGKLDIDYQVLHDAFFKHQTKPKNMTRHGDLYFEGKENIVKLTRKKPGHLSPALREALGMPTSGAGAQITPPPWLHSMQRYGPPPSYPRLKIPGLNAPLPEGAQWGFQPQGWGKPPVDAWGRPLFGDVFGVARQAAAQAAAAAITAVGTAQQEEAQRVADEAARLAQEVSGEDQLYLASMVDRSHWGDIEIEDEEESSSEEDDSSDESGDDDEDEGAREDEEMASVASVSSVASVASVQSSVRVPETLDLRKKRATEDENAPKKQLYTVLDQKSASVDSNSIMGSSHQYVVPGVNKKEGE